MEGKKATELNHIIYKCINENRIAEALGYAGDLALAATDSDLVGRLDAMRTSYSFLLRYFAGNMPDPGRDQMLHDIKQRLYTLADQLAIDIHCQNTPGELFYSLFKIFKDGESLETLTARYSNALQRCAAAEGEAHISLLQECERIEQQLFKKVWLTFPMSEHECRTLSDFLSSEIVEMPAKAIVLSALFISLSKVYDSTKLSLLIQTYIAQTNPELQIRALIYVTLTIFLNRNRASRDKNIAAKLALLAEQENFATDIQNIILRLVAARNTENLTQKMKNEIMPGIINAAPDLMRKIKDASVMDIGDIEDNPEWANALEKSGFTEKMEEMNKMQMQGEDVYMSTFSHLKSFTFFADIANWFMPFNPRHSVVMKAFEGDLAKVRALVSKAPFMCNSDKFSLTLVMSQMKDSQLNMLSQQFAAESEHYEELDEHTNTSRDDLANRHIQDLYRFYNLYSRKREFANVFATALNLLDVEMIANLLQNPTEMADSVANVYLKNKFYADAIHYFKLGNGFSGTVSPDSLQKIGFAYQQLGNHTKALDYYSKYELVRDNDLWTTRQIAACHRALKQYALAIKYLRKAEALAPENAAIALSLADCLLLSGDTENALKSYFKADYLKPDNRKAMRLIAWCSMLLANYEQSENYFQKLAATQDFSAQDHLNHGHLALAQGDYAAAVARYKKSLAATGDTKSFAATFLLDAKELARCGVDASTFSLALDAALLAE